MKTVAHVEEFLRLSQRELHSALNLVKLEYVTDIRKFAEAARDDQLKRLRHAIRPLDLHPQPELRVELVGMCISGPCELNRVP